MHRKRRTVPLLIAVVLALLMPRSTPALAAGSTISLDRGSYTQGQTLTVTYATDQVSSTNWVGIYTSTGKPGSVGSLMWKYTPGSSGTVSFATSSLAPGSYTAHYLYNDGYTELATPVPFTVTAPTSGSNLIVNGDAEFADASTSGYDGVTIPGWQVTGVPTIVGYTVGNGFPTAQTPGPANRGNQFFAGGPVGTSTLTQTVDVSAAASAIDGGGVGYTLSGWLGGYASEDSRTTVTITFRNGSGSALRTAQIGPVTAADRNNTTSLLQRSSSATVPAGTRSVGVVVQLKGTTMRDNLNQYDDAYADNLSLTFATNLPAAGAPSVPPSSVPAFDHVFFTMLENRSYDQVIGNSAAPYLSQLASANVALAQSYGAVHPSDPNYMAVAGGSTFGHTDNPYPGGIGTIDAPHIGDSVEAAGKTWKGYIEDMGTNCNRTSSGYFDVDNLPFLFFKNIANDDTRCRAHLQPVSQFWTDLQATSTTPNFVWFEPNTCNTMHSCSTSTGDTWFKNNLPKLFASPAWTQQRSLLIITFDEDDSSHGQRIPTIVVGSPGTVKTGYTSQSHYTHYSVSRTMETALGLPTLTRNDGYANPLNDVWR
jgi:hypothetical protein